MQEGIWQSPVFKKFLADAPAMAKDFHAFKAKYRKLWDANHEAKTLILQCHLILEAFLTEYLEHANPAAARIGEMRLTFSQKAELAYNPHTNFTLFMDGIVALNSLRNRLAHRVGYKVTDGDIVPIARVLKIWKDAAGDPMPQGLGIVTTFTELVCGCLDATTQSIKRHGNSFGFQGLLDWYKEDHPAEQSPPAYPEGRADAASVSAEA